jgi:hypothetical protein
MKTTRSLMAIAGALVATALMSGQTINDFMVGKIYDGSQTSGSGSSFASPGYGIFTEVMGTGLSGTYTVATPGGTVTSPLTLTGNASERQYEVASTYADVSALNAAYANGDYTFAIPASGGPFSPTLSLTGDAFPNTFSITGLTNGTWSGGNLVFNPGQSLTLTFDSFSGMVNGTDRIFFNADTGYEIETSVAGTTSFLVPANSISLSAGQTTSAELVFAKVVDFDNTTISGASGMAVYATIVSITLQAIPEPSTYAAIFGTLALAGVAMHRRRRTA